MFEHSLTRRTAVKAFGFFNLSLVSSDGMTHQSDPPSVTEKPNRFLDRRRIVDYPTEGPLVETADDIKVGAGSGGGDVSLSTIRSSATPNRTGTYLNLINLSPRYTFLRNEGGSNNSTTTNLGRTGIAANRVRAVQLGQGDLYAFNGSVTVNSTRPGARHWLASPAGILFGGTVAGGAEGAYLNPFEIYLSDKPGDTAFNCAAIGAVYNLNRNRRSGNELGQVWSGIRIQSVGAEFVDNMLSGTGKFSVGVDLSMPALDFGPQRAAIALKANDRLYFNASADEQRTGSYFVRADWVATGGFGEYSTYDKASKEWRVVLSGAPVLRVSADHIHVNKLLFEGGVIISGRQSSGWTRMSGPEDCSRQLDTATVTLKQLAERVKALETVLHETGGYNGFIGA